MISYGTILLDAIVRNCANFTWFMSCIRDEPPLWKISWAGLGEIGPVVSLKRPPEPASCPPCRAIISMVKFKLTTNYPSAERSDEHQKQIIATYPGGDCITPRYYAYIDGRIQLATRTQQVECRHDPHSPLLLNALG